MRLRDSTFGRDAGKLHENRYHRCDGRGGAHCPASGAAVAARARGRRYCCRRPPGRRDFPARGGGIRAGGERWPHRGRARSRGGAAFSCRGETERRPSSGRRWASRRCHADRRRSDGQPVRRSRLGNPSGQRDGRAAWRRAQSHLRRNPRRSTLADARAGDLSVGLRRLSRHCRVRRWSPGGGAFSTPGESRRCRLAARQLAPRLLSPHHHRRRRHGDGSVRADPLGGRPLGRGGIRLDPSFTG